MSIFFIFILGLFFGSFLNVLADRLPNSKSILGRSSCEFCRKELSWIDLIPILSFMTLKGRCRYCHKKLPLAYPLSELFTGVIFALTYLLVNLRIFLEIVDLKTLFMGDVFVVLTSLPITYYILVQHVFVLFIVSVMIVIFLADKRYGIIPDKVLAVGIIATAIYLLYINYYLPFENGQWYMIFGQFSRIINHLVSGVGAFLFFLMIYVLTKAKGIGFGDVKFGFFMGLLLGFPDILLALYIAFLTGGVVAIILVLWKKKGMKSEVAFGPFLIIGTYVSFFLSALIMPQIMVFLS